MNHLKSIPAPKLHMALMSVVMLLSLASCGSVFDDLEPCPAGVEMRFVYDYNLESANAFPSQVDCLSLHIYDSDGCLTQTVTPKRSLLSDENWRLQLDLTPGAYHAIAYGGISCDASSFVHFPEPSTGSRYQEISMRLLDSHIGTRLHDHFHGAADFVISDDSQEFTQVTMKMTKTTNHFRILLRQLDGEPLDGNDFEFYITDDNKELDHANTPVKSGHDITYPSWIRGKVEDVAYGEISTSRLHLSNSPRLVVANKNHDTRAAAAQIPEDDIIIDLPLNTYLLMSKSEAEGWENQEYLDRCSNWNMTFFLDSGHKWHKTEIIINNWTIRINDIEQ